MKYANQACIFCGGLKQATTEEHCPPKAMFRANRWPEGYSFPACAPCNNGTSNDDLIVAFLAQLNPAKYDEQTASKGAGLMKAINRQEAGLLPVMMRMSVREARERARQLGIRPGPGQLYRDLSIAKVTPEMRRAVQTIAGKLTKAVYFRETSKIFPNDGAIMCQWFTNAQKEQYGHIPALKVFGALASMSTPKKRGGKDLSDQFDYLYSSDQDGQLQVIQAVFNQVFGFVTIASARAGQLEAMNERLRLKTGKANGPFDFLVVAGST